MLRNGLEPWHLLILAIVIIVLFGSKKLPDAARGLGKSMRILKSEAEAMKKDGAERHAAGPAEGAAPAEPARHIGRPVPDGTPQARPHVEDGPAH
ncbi:MULTISPECIES: Sec-independent protein translocase subunit TatA [unclassified Streptomyces]|uniref:Sec-independent protein translocase subunit TatA n=1 Tax=unclassified Streptomyces TaxID=2593676 RepID=UPI0001C19DF0|nr:MULTISPECIES: Sec-independent protein translocase subunit TatA [unclassified Streptomyces]AEN10900.1 twin-arginine translocation protein, TatA/E family subunit [Streptomyces sp. SirexAA-E]MYR69303.1 twin-arginine translocase TatA/TatE family subunit [Streptomyces sp. SID4939]MYS01095.1 twin-arginine translocase TatA/TatE family subunit [Streptomyces sp. SID4940]MYT63831.1 twin-arginine translocase TatA/TatE family subunit [Streptomyces sp. SID8357]MYT86081.1 twin-arginine translocase TatA/T